MGEGAPPSPRNISLLGKCSIDRSRNGGWSFHHAQRDILLDTPGYPWVYLGTGVSRALIVVPDLSARIVHSKLDMAGVVIIVIRKHQSNMIHDRTLSRVHSW